MSRTSCITSNTLRETIRPFCVPRAVSPFHLPFFHTVYSYSSPYYQTIRESVVKIYTVTNKFQLILNLHLPHEIIACAATHRTFAYVRLDPQGHAYVRLFAISQDASVSPSPDGREIKLLDNEPNVCTMCTIQDTVSLNTNRPTFIPAGIHIPESLCRQPRTRLARGVPRFRLHHQ